MVPPVKTPLLQSLKNAHFESEDVFMMADNKEEGYELK